eukprot:scaffold62023_cov23-Cyclotella_meneghiniana.AAC.2
MSCGRDSPMGRAVPHASLCLVTFYTRIAQLVFGSNNYSTLFCPSHSAASLVHYIDIGKR